MMGDHFWRSSLSYSVWSDFRWERHFAVNSSALHTVCTRVSVGLFADVTVNPANQATGWSIQRWCKIPANRSKTLCGKARRGPGGLWPPDSRVIRQVRQPFGQMDSPLAKCQGHVINWSIVTGLLSIIISILIYSVYTFTSSIQKYI